MIIRSFYLVSIASYFSLLSFSAYAARVTFEEVALSGIGSQGQLAFQSRTNDYLAIGGLIFTPTATSENIAVNGAEFIDARSYLNFANNGTNTLSSYTNSADFSFSISSKYTQIFSLSSIDLARYGSTSMPSTLDSVKIRGYRYDGTILNRAINLGLIPDGLGGNEDFEKFTFDTEWQGLSLVEIGPNEEAGRNIFYIDNITFDAAVVPLPASVWLFGSGLLVLINIKKQIINTQRAIS